MYALNSVLN